MKKLIEETTVEDAKTKEKQLADGPKAAYGYGGKFGVQQDRWDFFFNSPMIQINSCIQELRKKNSK